MTPRLAADEVAHHVRNLRERTSLTELQAARLDAVVGTLGPDGRFLLRDALVAAEFPDGDARGQEAFQDFRKRVNTAAATAGVDLRLELDSRKARPDDRHGWFTGGDLVDEGIASFTTAASGGTGITHPVRPEVTEIGARTRVYVGADPGRRTTALLTQLRETLTLDPDRRWVLADTGSAGIGEDPDALRDQLSARAHVRLALISPAYLAGDDRRRVLDRPGPAVAFAVSGLPDGPLDLGRLRRHDVHRRGSPWDELTRAGQRRHYVDEIVDALRRELDRPGRAADEPLEVWTSARAWQRRAGESAVAVPPDAAEASLRESRLDATATGPALPAVDRLVDWATGDGPPLCALLGDVGMGKTTTAKLFTRRLLELRGQGDGYPLPLLFDLRDVRIATLAESMTLDAILDGMLDATRPPDVPSSRLDAATVRSRLTRGDAVVVFDGLDEVLVHLSPHDQKMFTRQLWRAAEGGTRMLVTCRTQYFRTIRDEIGCFTGEDRQALRGEHYLALLMQPFREEQVREYLKSNVDREGDWVDGFLATVATVHDLTDLAQRPLTLRLIADQVEFIETAKLAGRRIRSVDLYGEFVDRWLSRDGGKHTLTPEHKRLLMEEIAAGLWRSGRSSWAPDEVDDWLLELLERRPELQRHYRERVPDLWKSDFRTATFLARDREKDTFEFGHRSLFEYFLARYLLRTLRELGTAPEQDTSALAMAVPSAETLEFLGQSVAETSGADRSAVLAGLERTRDAYVARVSELALAYAAHAVAHWYPRHGLNGVQLGGARLRGVVIGRPDAPPLSLAGADLAGADLSDAVLHGVDLTRADLSGSDLTRAELHACRLDSARVHGARMTGTILRRCSLHAAGIGDAVTHRAQVLFCDPAPAERAGLLVAPSPDGPQPAAGALQPLSGHTWLVRAAAWSPDGTRILTGGHGGARIWDAATHEVLATLDAHGGEVFVVAWSPDGTRLLTGSAVGLRMWHASTRTVGWHAACTLGTAWSVAWSPDGTRVLAGDRDTVRIRDATTGQTLCEHDSGADVLGWSPDGTRVLAAGPDGLRVWDASGPPGPAIADGPIFAASWSPDGTRILCGRAGGATIRDAVTGASLSGFQVGDHSGDEDTPGPTDVMAVEWSPDGRHVLTCVRDGTTHLWDVGAADPIELVGSSGSAGPVSWSPDGGRILVAGSDGALLWNAQDQRLAGTLPSQANAVTALAWSGERLLALDGGIVRVLDLTDGGSTSSISMTITGTGPRLAWSPGATRVVSVETDGGVRVRDTGTGAILLLLDSASVFDNVAWSVDGTRILVAGPDGLRDFDATTGELLRQHPDVVHLLTGGWSPDGNRLLTFGPDTVQLIDTGTGAVVSQLTGGNGQNGSVGWSPDSDRVVTGDSDGALRIWDARTSTELIRSAPHGGPIHDMAWSGDGRWIASGRDGCVLIHDAGTGELVHHVTGHSDWVGALAWSADSTRLACGGYDGRIHLVDAATGETVGLRFAMLPDREVAAFDAATDTLVGASLDAWRWLGWSTVRNGVLTRLPAETFGPLPPLPAGPQLR